MNLITIVLIILSVVLASALFVMTFLYVNSYSMDDCKNMVDATTCQPYITLSQCDSKFPCTEVLPREPVVDDTVDDDVEDEETEAASQMRRGSHRESYCSSCNGGY